MYTLKSNRSKKPELCNEVLQFGQYPVVYFCSTVFGRMYIHMYICTYIQPYVQLLLFGWYITLNKNNLSCENTSQSNDSSITNLSATYLKNVTITPPYSLCFTSYNLITIDSVESVDFVSLDSNRTLHFTIILFFYIYYYYKCTDSLLIIY